MHASTVILVFLKILHLHGMLFSLIPLPCTSSPIITWSPFIPDMRTCVISITGFSPDSSPSRETLKSAIDAIGACYLGPLCRGVTTHLLCRCASGAKVEAAAQWGEMPLLRAEWVLTSLREGRRAEEGKFPVEREEDLISTGDEEEEVSLRDDDDHRWEGDGGDKDCDDGKGRSDVISNDVDVNRDDVEIAITNSTNSKSAVVMNGHDHTINEESFRPMDDVDSQSENLMDAEHSNHTMNDNVNNENPVDNTIHDDSTINTIHENTIHDTINTINENTVNDNTIDDNHSTNTNGDSTTTNDNTINDNTINDNTVTTNTINDNHSNTNTNDNTTNTTTNDNTINDNTINDNTVTTNTINDNHSNTNTNDNTNDNTINDNHSNTNTNDNTTNTTINDNTTNTITNTLITQNTTQSTRRSEKRPTLPHVFLLSGDVPPDAPAIISRLGGTSLPARGPFTAGATHLLTGSLRRTEKYLGAVACGLWVVKPSFLTACEQAGTWVDETPFEWDEAAADSHIDPACIRRRRREGGGAFQGARWDCDDINIVE